MALVPALDPSQNDNAEDARTIPHNIELEQALLGVLLFDNETFHKIEAPLEPRHFYEPFHARLYAAVAGAISRGVAAEPFAIGQGFLGDSAFQELGGLRYLADLVDRAPPSAGAGEFAATIVDLAIRRDLMRLGADMIEAAAGAGARAQIEAAEAELLAMNATTRRASLVTIGDALDHMVAYIDDRSQPVGIITGLRPLDNHIGPLLPGDLIAIGARPNMGKSALATALGTNVASPQLAAHMNGVSPRDLPGARGVIAIHAEMTFGDAATGGQAVRRHLSDIGFSLYGAAFPTYRDIRDKKVSAEQRVMVIEAADYLRRLPIVGVKRTGLTLSSLRSMARRQAALWRRQEVELGLITVDHVGLMKVEDGRKDLREAQTEISHGLKELADELGCVICALIQLSRKVEDRNDKRPQISDLKESGAWEEDADVVILPYRDAYYASREKEPNSTDQPLKWNDWDQRRKSPEVELIIGKLREGASGDSASVWADMGHNAFRGAAPEKMEVLF